MRNRILGRALVSVAAVAGLLLSGAAPAAASPNPPSVAFGEVWHRLNPDFVADTNNEHERQTCRENGASLSCFYDKIPESLPGFTWNSTTGDFTGRNVTSSWTCPAWFPAEVCANTTAVYSGVAVYHPASGQPFTVAHEAVFTSLGGEPVLYLHWVGLFACPWYQTFAEALAANPAHAGDCAVAT